MGTTFKYLLRHLLKMISLVLAIVTVLELFILLVTEVGVVGEGSYNVTAMLSYVFMSLPNQVYQLSPMIMLLGATLALGQLALYNEVMVLRAAGMSVARFSMCVLGCAVLISSLFFALGEGIAAPMISHARMLKNSQLHVYAVSGSAHSLWFRHGHEIIHIDHVRGNHVEGVQINEFSPNFKQLLGVIRSKSADIAAHSWLLHHVTSNKFAYQRSIVQQYLTKQLLISASPQLLLSSMDGQGVVSMGNGVGQRDSLWTLYRVIHDRVQLGLASRDFGFAFWQRILQPMVSVLMILLAVPMTFKCFSRMVFGKTVMVSLMVAFAIYMSNQLIGPLCMMMQLPVLWAAMFPIILLSCCYMAMIFMM